EPLRRSLPPGCRMTALVPFGTVRSRRCNMPSVVSPLMPALTTRPLAPFARHIASSCAGEDWLRATPLAYVFVAQSATIVAAWADADTKADIPIRIDKT